MGIQRRKLCGVWAEHGCTVYRTDLHGDIHLSIQQGDEHEKEQ